jgi:MIP family channel proteins
VERREWPAFVAEFIGTFLLVFFVCTTVSLNTADPVEAPDLAVIGLVHAFVLAMLVYTLGGTSGAHFNPAVTAVLAALRKITPGDAAVYVLVQLAAAIAGALVVKLLLLDEGAPSNYGATTVTDLVEGKALAGLLAEIIGTFVLVWAIMGALVNPRGDRNWAGLVIGITLGFAVMAIAPISGAGVNPARSFGPALVASEWSDFWIYVIGPVVGALLAGFGYRFTVLEPLDRAERRPVDTLR